MTSKSWLEQTIDAMRQGKIVLHPTDNMPGLTCDPSNPSAIRNLARIKGRDPTKPLIGLVADLETAKTHFAPLPNLWDRALAELWPGPLSVIWQASAAAPRGLVGGDGTICLRCIGPGGAGASWAEVINAMKMPLPSTSVNLAGDPPATTWESASHFAASQGVFVPPLQKVPSFGEGQPSTVVGVWTDGGYQILRQGAVGEDVLSTVLGLRSKIHG